MKRDSTTVIVSIIILCVIYVTADFFVNLPIGDKSIEIEIPRGATFRQAVEILSDEGLIRNKTLFIIIGRISGLDRKIRAGYYSIYGSTSPFDILRMMKRGQVIEYEITIVEGDSLREIGEKLSAKGVIGKEEFMELSAAEDFLSLHDIDAPSLEGYLFPDTYRIPKGTDQEDALGMMIGRMREKYSGNLIERTFELGFSEREVLTLASIIEKEATKDIERPIISAVYHNRLKRGIPLQADPTCIYGVKSYREKITKRDLLRKTRYNTYTIKGLPPGPICSSGIESIRAALYPAEVPYLYFVSNGDGTHTFSVRLQEHLAAIKSIREKKRTANIEKTGECMVENEGS